MLLSGGGESFGEVWEAQRCVLGSSGPCCQWRPSRTTLAHLADELIAERYFEALKESKVRGSYFQQQNYVPGQDNPTGQDLSADGIAKPQDGNFATVPPEEAKKQGDTRL